MKLYKRPETPKRGVVVEPATNSDVLRAAAEIAAAEDARGLSVDLHGLADRLERRVGDSSERRKA